MAKGKINLAAIFIHQGFISLDVLDIVASFHLVLIEP